MSVIYFLVCVRKHESNLLVMLAQQWGRKHFDMQKNAILCVKPNFYLTLQHGMF